MLRNRKDYPSVRTPKGTAIWPALNEPDYKFKENGEFHARLAFDPDTPGLAELVAQAEAIRDEAYEAKKEELTRQKKGALLKKLSVVPVIKDEEDRETGEPTGRVILRAALTYRVDIKNGPRAGETFYKEPDLFDARGKRLFRTLKNGKPNPNLPKIGSGSEMKLNVTIQDYETDGGTTIGARFELNAAQIIKLVSNGEREAGDYGFGEEEGDSIDADAPDDAGFEDEGEGFSPDDNPDF